MKANNKLSISKSTIANLNTISKTNNIVTLDTWRGVTLDTWRNVTLDTWM